MHALLRGHPGVTAVMEPLVVLACILTALALMLVELAVSNANERVLMRLGALDAPDPVYATMRWAYPLSFVIMALEGLVWGLPGTPVMWSGAAVFVAGKAFKAWAIVTLGHRWTYRVIVLPGAPLVNSGPYTVVRHPNYVGVLGEFIGFALLVGARVSGPVSTLFFMRLLWLRIVAEERALGLRAG